MLDNLTVASVSILVWIAGLALWSLLWAFACSALGGRAGRSVLGFFLGLLFGPLGAALTACFAFSVPPAAPAAPAAVPPRRVRVSARRRVFRMRAVE